MTFLLSFCVDVNLSPQVSIKVLLKQLLFWKHIAIALVPMQSLQIYWQIVTQPHSEFLFLTLRAWHSSSGIWRNIGIFCFMKAVKIACNLESLVFYWLTPGGSKVSPLVFSRTFTTPFCKPNWWRVGHAEQHKNHSKASVRINKFLFSTTCPA